MQLNTPARAAQVQRPQTRAWRRLLSEANEQSINALEIRAQLRQHLQAAERLAERRAPAKPSLQVLESVSADWNIRVEMLTALRDDPKSFDIRPVAPWLVIQLEELRSAVVVAAAAAIASISVQKLFSPEQAKEIFIAAANGVHVSKKVMANARKQAAMSVVHGQTDKIVHNAVADVINSAHASARILAVDAFVEIVGSALEVTQVEEYLVKILGKLAVDKDSRVRDATRNLKKIVETRFAADKCAKMLDRLPTEAARRLNGYGDAVGTSKAAASMAACKRNKASAVRKGTHTSMKALIRERRKAMVADASLQKEVEHGLEGGAIKGRGAIADSRGLPDFKKMVHVTSDKENRPNLSSANPIL